MRAEQQKKRLNTAAMVGCPSNEQYRVNKKRVQVQKCNLNLSPIISLEWDNKKKSVVSKQGQIGLARRQLIPHLDPGSCSHSALADVFSVPQEIFDLENLSDVLSYEVWHSHLSDRERSFLLRFLPEDPKPDAIVRALLAGDNFHFRNPFVKWSYSLCLGELHPDSILHEDQSRKASKKSYCTYLHNYHHDMIRNLQMWKEKWNDCKDPEVDMVQNILSVKKHAETSTLPIESSLCGIIDNLVATPESCSWANSETACSSDNQNSGMVYDESQRRKDLNKSFADSSNGQKWSSAPKKGEKPRKQDIRHGDGAKYMSYVKVSREQHARFRNSLKHTGNSIQPSSLNVLGNIDSLDVQPFERFEEEESKKLHEYWLKLATKEIPEGFTKMRKRLSQLQELARCLSEEIEQKMSEKTTRDDEKGVSLNKSLEIFTYIGEGRRPSATTKFPEKMASEDLLQEQGDSEVAIPEMTTDLEDENAIRGDYIFEEQRRNHCEIAGEADVPNRVFIHNHCQQQIASLDDCCGSKIVSPNSPGFLHDPYQLQVGSLDSYHQTDSIEMESSGDRPSARRDEHPAIVSVYPRNLNHINSPVRQGGPFSSASNVWPVADVHGYYGSTGLTNRYASAHDLSIVHPQYIHGEPVEMLGLESDQLVKDAGKDILCIQTDDFPFLSSYTNPNRSELLQSVFKDQSNLSCHLQEKQLPLDFHHSSNLMMERGKVPGSLIEQIHPSLSLELRQKRSYDLYNRGSMYSGGGFAVPRLNQLQASDQEWASVNAVRMAVHPEPHPNGGLSQNLHTCESGIRDGWPSFDAAIGVNHSLSSGSSADQALYTVVSECNEFRPHISYESMGSMDGLNLPGNCSGIGRGTSSTGLFVPHSSNPLNYLSDHEAASGLKLSNLGWMSMPPQNSRIQERMGKPYLKSWNQ